MRYPYTKRILGAALFILLFAAFALPETASAQEDRRYEPLAPLPGTLYDEDAGTTDLQSYIPGIFKLAIGLAIVLAVFMIVVGGITYITSDAIQGKTQGKEYITNAVLGLVLTIASWLILYTINPSLVTFDLGIAGSGGSGTLSEAEVEETSNERYRLVMQQAEYAAVFKKTAFFTEVIKENGERSQIKYDSEARCAEDVSTINQSDALELVAGCKEVLQDRQAFVRNTKVACEKDLLNNQFLEEEGYVLDEEQVTPCAQRANPSGNTLPMTFEDRDRCMLRANAAEASPYWVVTLECERFTLGEEGGSDADDAAGTNRI